MLFLQASVVAKYLKQQDKQVIDTAYQKFTNHFHNPQIQSNIRHSKEEQYQEGFLRDLFVNILGYKLNPDTDFNLTTELKNVKDAKKADGGILVGGKVLGVIELKGCDTTDLAKIETQAFGYKNNQPDCIYVITANFEKIRLYINNAIEHIEWNLFSLSAQDFARFYLLLAYPNIAKGIAEKIKAESISQEEAITKQLYADYAAFKRELFASITQLNPAHNKLALFKKTQKLLDRFLFLFFAEDKGLLPPNSVSVVLTNWRKLQDMDTGISLYDRFKKYFGYLNTGFKGKHHDVFAYNGGLFKPDNLLDGIVIDDEVLFTHAHKLANYDFASEVDVNILGHIFENSLNELDEIKSQLAGGVIDKSQTKRKKDGVFYTPKYITQYIVENTLGKLCTEKKQALTIIDAEYATDKKITKKKQQAALDKLTEYRNWLLELTICDPACGSGAFLNQALSFLIDEHVYLDELEAKITGGSLIFKSIENSILENNLYGVDINEESVEIAKLALWLRTAKPQRKLTSLSSNIKCGNSLIDDPQVTENAFNWQAEFPQVFAKGGFDVVIGNPPYIKEYTHKYAFDGLHQHPCYQGKMDLWYFFGWLALQIVKPEIGIISYIAPNNWITNAGASLFRDIILKQGKMIEFVNFNDFKVFKSAGIQTMIYIMSASKDNCSYNVSYSQVLDKNINEQEAINFLHKLPSSKFTYFNSNISRHKFKDKYINFIDLYIEKILDTIHSKKHFFLNTKEVAQGIVAPQDFINTKSRAILGDDFNVGDGIFNLSHKEYKNLNVLEHETRLIKPFFNSDELGRYSANANHSLWIIYTDSKFKKPTEIERFPNIKKHLDQFKKVITSDNKPYGLHRAREEKFFKGEKIFSIRKAIEPTFTYTDFDCYVSQTYYSIKTDKIDLKSLVVLLNSSLIKFLLKYKGKMQGDIFQIDKEPLLNIPIVKPQHDKPFIDAADTMLTLNQNLQEITSKFTRILQRKFESLEKLPKALQTWYNLDYKEFTGQLAKKKIKLSLSQEAEWEEYFLAEQAKALALKNQINTTDKKIDHMVYQLYGLTADEIKIVEDSTQ